jgi:hypothetical protein
MKEKILGAAVFTSVALLSACHQDALKREPQDKSVAFLIKASTEAGKKLHMSYKPSHAYSFCMTGNPTKINCDALYEEMLAVAKTSDNFKDLTRTELTDQAAFQAMKEPMDIKLFNTLDDDEDI